MNRPPILRFLLFLLLQLAWFLPVHAQQLTKFSGDSTKFIGELNQLFSTLSDADRKIVEQEMVVFVQNWNAEKFDAPKKRIIYRLSSLMLKKKLRAFPDIYNYLKGLDAFLSSAQPDPSFYDWSDILLKLADSKNSRNLSAFIDETRGLFEGNLLYESPSTTWRATNRNFKFYYDTVPVVIFQITDLICFSNRDSLTIYGTRGQYYPLTTRWIGTGGKVDWQRAGLDPGQVYAKLGDYGIQMKFSKYTADSAEFYNRKYFSSSLIGQLTDKVQADVEEERASYPRFRSYESYLGIPGVFKDIDFYGGFAMEGARVIGFGDRNRDAILIFKKDGREFVTARSKNFVIRPDRINSGLASVTIHHDEDSIYHSGLQFKYLDEPKELSMTKDERQAVISPWFDSYHDIEIYCEALYWKTNQNVISFEAMRGPATEGKAVFESDNYYSLERYERLRGIDELNPLNVIRSYTERKQSKEFTLDELVRYMQKPPDQVEGLLLLLNARGFLIYDQDDKRAVVKDKLIHYVDAKNGKADYDIIVMNSEVAGKSNAMLNLENFNLKILGVERVLLSDSQQVYIYPTAGELVMQKDRNFSFSGKVEAGLFDFYSKGCSFDYGNFKLAMPEIDTMEFYTRGNKKDPKTQEYPMVKVRSQLSDFYGELLIDAPDNKSGRRMLDQYPVFTSKDTARVNWDKSYVYNGVYDKKTFYFEALPFTLRSLDKMVPDTLRFDGMLTSAGVFPEIREKLKIRPDYSLGFETQTPDSGLAVYAGKGTFSSKIDLSNQGLRGDGTLRYLNSVSVSDNFIFFPDSMKAVARTFNTAEMIAAVEYPIVTGDSVVEYWMPYSDSMSVSTLKKVMSMYKDQSTFAGTLSLTPQGMMGNGTIRIRDAEMDSKGFNFKQHTFDALIANFRIRSYDLAALSISTKNYRTHFDFDLKRGEFKSNVGISRIEFPFNQYICSMDRFDWMLDNEEITLMNESNMQGVSDSSSMASLIDVGYVGSEFISVSPAQDSLRWFAMKARYNLKTNVINADDVKIIKVADAAIFPDSGKVRIMKDARMEILHNAGIIANTVSRYHNFYRADVAIATRHKYDAKGFYDYLDIAGERQQIWFSRIAVDTAGNTFAKGTVTDSAQFRLCPQIGFAGDILLDAPQKFLTFDGGFKPITDCQPLQPQYVRFTAPIDPMHVAVPVDPQPKNLIRENLTAGLMMSNTQGRIYPVFFEKRYSFSDSVMIEASGMMEYKNEGTSFTIAPPVQEEKGARGSSVALNTTNCLLSGTGPLKTGMNVGNLNMETWGTVSHYVLPDSTSMRVAIALRFPFNDQAVEKFRQQVTTINLPGVMLLTTPFSVAMDYLANPNDLKNLKTEIEQFGRFRKFPDELKRTLFLADVKLSWDSVAKAWVSNGPIGIGSIGDQLIPRYVEGKIEFAKKRNGDDFTILLKLSETAWYFFNYRNNILQTISSNLEYNDLIIQAQQNSAEQKRIDREAKGFRYTISTERKRRDFIRKFEAAPE
jgi:hypothetical protein